MKLVRLFVTIMFLSVCFLVYSCEETTSPEENDTTPPSVTITSPQNNSTVSEIVTITCMSSDNVGVEKVELWVGGVSTGVEDISEPYSLEWNTTEFDDGEFTIVIRSYDESDNTTDSEPITLTVDNSQSYPTPVEIQSVLFDNNSFVVTWTPNHDDDFQSYTLWESFSSDMSEMSDIYTSTDPSDTTFTISQISPGEERFYQILIKDLIGLESLSQIIMGSSYPTILYMSIGNGDQEIYKINQGSNNPVNLTNNDDYDYFPSWTHTGDQIIFGRIYDFPLGRDILIMNSDGTGEINLTNTSSENNYSPVVTPDGNSIVYRSDIGGDDDIYIMNIDGSNKTNLTNDEFWEGYPQISPNGDKIVWTSRRTGVNRIWIMNIDGSDPLNLTSEFEGDWSNSPIFSPEGDEVLYITGTDTTREMLIIGTDGTNDRRILLTTNEYPNHISYSPSGDKILFTIEEVGGIQQIYTIGTDGSGLTLISESGNKYNTPKYSPDGSKIIYSKEDDGWNLYVMNSDGSEIEQVTDSNGHELYPSFQP